MAPIYIGVFGYKLCNHIKTSRLWHGLAEEMVGIIIQSKGKSDLYEGHDGLFPHCLVCVQISRSSYILGLRKYIKWLLFQKNNQVYKIED